MMPILVLLCFRIRNLFDLSPQPPPLVVRSRSDIVMPLRGLTREGGVSSLVSLLKPLS